MLARKIPEANPSVTYEPFIELIEASCEIQSGVINIKRTLLALMVLNDPIAEIFEKYDWISFYVGKKQVSQEQGIQQYHYSFSSWEVTLIQRIFESMSHKKGQPGPLRRAIYNYYGLTDKNNFSEVLHKFLNDVGILNTVQYVFCVSLLTGGRQDNEISIETANQLFADAGLTWLNVLGFEFSLIAQMITELDDPTIALAYFKEPKVTLNMLCCKARFRENYYEYLLANHKTNILNRIIKDLSLPEIIQLKNVGACIAQSAELTATAERKKRNAVNYINAAQTEMTVFLNHIKDLIQALSHAKLIPATSQSLADDLIAQINLELNQSIFQAYDGIYKTLAILLAQVDIDYHKIKRPNRMFAFTMLSQKHYEDYLTLQKSLLQFEKIMFTAQSAIAAPANDTEYFSLDALLQIMCDWFHKALHIESESLTKFTYETLILLKLTISHFALKLRIIDIKTFVQEVLSHKILLEGQSSFLANEYQKIAETFLSKLHATLLQIGKEDINCPSNERKNVVIKWGLNVGILQMSDAQQASIMDAEIMQIMHQLAPASGLTLSNS